jgi:hypothetical protein
MVKLEDYCTSFYNPQLKVCYLCDCSNSWKSCLRVSASPRRKAPIVFSWFIVRVWKCDNTCERRDVSASTCILLSMCCRNRTCELFFLNRPANYYDSDRAWHAGWSCTIPETPKLASTRYRWHYLLLPAFKDCHSKAVWARRVRVVLLLNPFLQFSVDSRAGKSSISKKRWRLDKYLTYHLTTLPSI